MELVKDKVYTQALNKVWKQFYDDYRNKWNERDQVRSQIYVRVRDKVSQTNRIYQIWKQGRLKR